MIRDEIDRVLDKIEGDTRLAKLRRNGLMVLREKFAPSEPQLSVTIEPTPQSIEVYGDQDENYAELSGSFPLPRSTDGPLDISTLVTIREVALDPLHVVFEIPFYEDDAAVADWDSGEFHPGIVATPPSNWFIELDLLSEGEADAFIQSADHAELFLKLPLPELGLTLVGVGTND